MLSNKLHYLVKKNNNFLSRKIRRVASIVRSLDISLLIALIFRRRSQINQLSNQANSGSKSSRI